MPELDLYELKHIQFANVAMIATTIFARNQYKSEFVESHPLVVMFPHDIVHGKQSTIAGQSGVTRKGCK